MVGATAEREAGRTVKEYQFKPGTDRTCELLS